MAPVHSLIWSSPARRDLLDIWAYVAQSASAETADRQLHLIESACSRLRDRPLMGRPRTEIQPGLRSILVQPYVAFYRVAGATVTIYRVVHGRRDLHAALHTTD